jgi:hypothetical protein
VGVVIAKFPAADGGTMGDSQEDEPRPNSLLRDAANSALG